MSDRIKIQRTKQLSNSYSYPQLATDTNSVGMDTTHGSANHDISRVSLRPQARLTVSQPGDIYEREADKVAQQVMGMSDRTVQREETPQEEELQLKPVGQLITPLLQLRAELTIYQQAKQSGPQGKNIAILAPDLVSSPPMQAKQNESHYRIASDITGVFEGGKPSSLQTKDAGIISYGKHQATLASGSLYSVLKVYTNLSNGNTVTKIANYLPQVQKKDAKLRENAEFLKLLKEAAKEPEMAQAQEQVFSKKYWEPAAKTAKKVGINSALGKAIFYDTAIQGGLESILKNTKQQLENKTYTEQEFLSVFLKERRKRLHRIAQRNRKQAEEKRAAGKEKDAKALEVNAKMLESSAKGRLWALEKLVQSGDLNLAGDEKGQIKIGSTKIAGLGKDTA